MALGQHIAVEKDFLLGLQTMFLATKDGVFLPFFEARVMVIIPNLDRHRVVILLNASCDFLKQLFLKRFRMFQTSIGILVLGFKISDNFRIFTLVEPVVVVDTGMTVYRHLMRMDGGLGWGWHVIHRLMHQNEKVKPKVGRMGS